MTLNYRRTSNYRYALACASALAFVLVTGCGGAKKGESQAAEAVAPVSVAVVNPAKKSVQGVLALNGVVHAENELSVVAETSGKVIKVYVDDGMRVSKGDIVAQIDDEMKQASYKTAQASYDKSKADWARAQDLFAQKVISDSDLQGSKLAFASAESQFLVARRDFENAKVRSPQNGVITQKFVTVGSMLSPGAPVVHVVDIDNLVLTVQVSERDILKVHANMNVVIDSDMYPDATFSGKVSAVSPKGDAALTFPVEIAIKSDSRKPLYAGMSARAHINLGSKTILAIPRAALVGAGENPQVYAVKDGVARLVSIETGSEYDTDVEVISGLTATDQVVSEGQNNLSDGSAVTVMEAISK
jgi:membrane fusion protein, multidrug efflux system